MFRKTKIALAIAMVLGAASAALASNEHDDSVTGAQAAREHGNPLPWWWNSSGNGRAAFAYRPADSRPNPMGRASKHR